LEGLNPRVTSDDKLYGLFYIRTCLTGTKGIGFMQKCPRNDTESFASLTTAHYLT